MKPDITLLQDAAGGMCLFGEPWILRAGAFGKIGVI
jgi:hypothetical protein